MSIFIRPFKVLDIEAFTPLEPMGKSVMDDPEFAKAVEDSDLAVTGIRNGEIVGCGGVHPTDKEGQGEIWLRLSGACQENMASRLDTLRWLKSGMQIVKETYPFRQINATVRCCFKEGASLVEYLGFKKTQEITHEGETWAIYSTRTD